MYQEQIKKIFENFNSPDAPGHVVGVISNGEFILKQAKGLANLELGVPMTSNTVFNIASMAKQFTAFAIALLESEGKLSLEDNIRTHLPKIQDVGHFVTIRHLVHHTSGIRDSFPELLALAGWRDTDMTTTEDVLRLLESQQALNFIPGDEFVYCNSNYVLMAEIVKQINGTSFADFCRTRIFEPLGMTSTFVNDNVFKPIKGRAASYYIEDGTFWYAPLTDSVVGPTNVYTNLEDLAKWDQNFYTGQVGGLDVIKRIIQPGCLNDGKVLDYAFGLEVGPAHTQKGWQLVEHGGGQAGYSTWMIRVPEKKMSVIVLFNSFMWSTRDYCIRVLDLFLEENPEVSHEPINLLKRSPINLSTPELEKWAGVYHHPVRGTIRQVSVKDDTLLFRANPLAPISGDKFYMSEMPEVEIHFTQETMTVISETEVVTYQKVDSSDLASVDLSTYVGTYFSPEIQQRWTITAEEKALTVSRWKYPQSRMTPIFKDAFNDNWLPIMGYPTNYTIIFIRDDANQITGLKVSGNGVRHLWFERM